VLTLIAITTGIDGAVVSVITISVGVTAAFLLLVYAGPGTITGINGAEVAVVTVVRVKTLYALAPGGGAVPVVRTLDIAIAAVGRGTPVADTAVALLIGAAQAVVAILVLRTTGYLDDLVFIIEALRVGERVSTLGDQSSRQMAATERQPSEGERIGAVHLSERSAVEVIADLVSTAPYRRVGHRNGHRH
jgi:hypothetical protein